MFVYLCVCVCCGVCVWCVCVWETERERLQLCVSFCFSLPLVSSVFKGQRGFVRPHSESSDECVFIIVNL